MNCPHCGTVCLPEHRFCKNCGATLGARKRHNLKLPARMEHRFRKTFRLLYSALRRPKAIPGTAQTYYYVPFQAATHTNATHHNLLEGLRHKNPAAWHPLKDLEGFSLKEMFSGRFQAPHRGGD